jgi:hypothetical protein
VFQKIRGKHYIFFWNTHHQITPCKGTPQLHDALQHPPLVTTPGLQHS